MKIKAILTCVLLCVTAAGFAQSLEDEYTMKSVFIAGFGRFVTWPEISRMNDKSKPFVLGIIGVNPFGKILENHYSALNQTINDKNVEIRYISTLDKIAGCHILFISSSCKSYLTDILAVTSNKPILTIGDTEGFAEQGVLINFYIQRRRIRFEINEALFQKASLKIDSLILREATIVKSK
ncbi:MAG: YfiR family protein [Candidatus Aminicenantes bacterium]|nr:YfiR family protein [Candidatus Aminicenantes bacterium]